MRKLLTDHVAPEQLDFFEFEADSHIAELFDSTAPIVAGHATAYGAGIPADSLLHIKAGLDYVVLLLSTFKALREAYAWWQGRQSKNEEELRLHLRRSWLADLQKTGMQDAEATRLVDGFLDDATTLAKQFQTAK